MKVVAASCVCWGLLAQPGCGHGSIERTDTIEGPETVDAPPPASLGADGATPDDTSAPISEGAMPTDDAAMPTDDAAMPTDDAAMPTDDAAMPTEPADCTPQDPGTISDLCDSADADFCETHGTLADALTASLPYCGGVLAGGAARSFVHFTTCDWLELRSADGFTSITTRYDASGEELVGASFGTDAIVCPPPVMDWGETRKCDGEGCMVCGGSTEETPCDAATVPDAARICREQETSLSPECTACACDACLPFALLTRLGANSLVPHFETCIAERCAACSGENTGL